MLLLRLTVSPRVVTTVCRATVITEGVFFCCFLRTALFDPTCCERVGPDFPEALELLGTLIPTILQILCKHYKYENDALRLTAAFQSHSQHEHLKLLIVVVPNNEVVIYRPVL